MGTLKITSLDVLMQYQLCTMVSSCDMSFRRSVVEIIFDCHNTGQVFVKAKGFHDQLIIKSSNPLTHLKNERRMLFLLKSNACTHLMRLRTEGKRNILVCQHPMVKEIFQFAGCPFIPFFLFIYRNPFYSSLQLKYLLPLEMRPELRPKGRTLHQVSSQNSQIMVASLFLKRNLSCPGDYMPFQDWPYHPSVGVCEIGFYRFHIGVLDE